MRKFVSCLQAHCWLIQRRKANAGVVALCRAQPQPQMEDTRRYDGSCASCGQAAHRSCTPRYACLLRSFLPCSYVIDCALARTCDWQRCAPSVAHHSRGIPLHGAHPSYARLTPVAAKPVRSHGQRGLLSATQYPACLHGCSLPFPYTISLHLMS